MKLQEIIDKVRTDLGGPSIVEYSDVSLSQDLRAGLIEYSKYKPLKKLGVFTTAADVQEYDLASSYAYFMGFDEVYYVSTASVVDDQITFLGTLTQQGLTQNNGLNVLENPSLLHFETSQMQILRDAQTGDWLELETGKVRLMPVPSSVQNVYFVYNDRKQVSDLREEEFTAIVNFTLVEAARSLGNKRTKILQVNDPSSGFVMFFGGKHLIQMSKDTKEMLEKEYGKGSVLRIG